MIDDAQGFADLRWPAVLAAPREEETGGLYDFPRRGPARVLQVRRSSCGARPLVLDHNPRHTRQTANSFSTLAPIRMRLGDVDGPDVRFVECRSTEALDHADDAVDVLLDEGWRGLTCPLTDGSAEAVIGRVGCQGVRDLLVVLPRHGVPGLHMVSALNERVLDKRASCSAVNERPSCPRATLLVADLA